MDQSLFIYNTLTRKKEKFEAINAPHVGMYVCGPTVYSDVHLGNCRTFMSFDLIFRYLNHLGYKVRYVRNVTDAGHLEGDAGDQGEDKISKKAKLAQLEPMEIVQKYTVGFHDIMQVFNVLPPSIEPTATGHIIEQIELVKVILEHGYAYEVDEEKGTFSREPEHDTPWSHGADAFQTFALSLKTEQDIKKPPKRERPVFTPQRPNSWMGHI